MHPVDTSLDISDWYFSTVNGDPEGVVRESQRISYQAIMESLGRLLVGYE